jgi:predicted alpha/beta-hydrolase family hydrolase
VLNLVILTLSVAEGEGPASVSGSHDPEVPNAMHAAVTFSDDSLNPTVRGFLHSPASPNGDALILTHGAGSNCNAPLLVAISETFAGRGYVVLRCDLPFRQERRTGPPFPGHAERDRAGLRNAVAVLSKNVSGRIFLGGHSYGGRQATMLCAAEPDLVSGLLLLSYPLHPPRKPEQLRIQHLPNLRTPSLFVHGTRDPFGTVEEMTKALQLIPAKTELMKVEGAGHDLGFKGKTEPKELPGKIALRTLEFFEDRRS